MKKLAIIFDSFSGRTKEQLEKKPNYYFLPLRVVVDKEEYEDGISLSTETMLKKIDLAKDIKTSQPSPAIMDNLFEKLSKEYENVVYLALGSCLSGTYQTANIFAQKYSNVYILNTRFVGIDFMNVADWMLKNTDMEISEMIAKVQKHSDKNFTYIIPKNNDAFIRSGRLGKTLAIVLNKAKVVPIISYEDSERLKKKMIKRSGTNAIKYVLDKLINLSKSAKCKFNIQICKSLDDSLVKIALKLLKERGINKKNIHIELAASLTIAHTGSGTISISVIRGMDGK